MNKAHSVDNACYGFEENIIYLVMLTLKLNIKSISKNPFDSLIEYSNTVFDLHKSN